MYSQTSSFVSMGLWVWRLEFIQLLINLDEIIAGRHDAQLVSKNKSSAVATVTDSAPLPTQQFGVGLNFIKEHNGGQVVPPIVLQCILFLSQPDGK